MPTNAKKIRIGGVSHDIEDTQARSDISALKSSFDKKLHTTENLLDTYFEWGVVNWDGTNADSTTAMRTAGYIDVEPNTTYAFYDAREWTKAEYNAQYPVQWVFEYDSNGVYKRNSTIYLQQFTTGADTYKVRFRSNTIPSTFDMVAFNAKPLMVVKGASYTDYVQHTALNVENQFIGAQSDNLFNGKTFDVYIGTTDGACNSSANSVNLTTDFIKVSASKLYWTIFDFTSIQYLNILLAYDSEKQFIGKVMATVLNDYTFGRVYTADLPNNTEFVILRMPELSNNTENINIRNAIKAASKDLFVSTSLEYIYSASLITGQNKISRDDTNINLLDGIRNVNIRDFMLSALNEYSDSILAGGYDCAISAMTDLHSFLYEPYAVLNYMSNSGAVDMSINLGDNIPDKFSAKADAVDFLRDRFKIQNKFTVKIPVFNAIGNHDVNPTNSTTISDDTNMLHLNELYSLTMGRISKGILSGKCYGYYDIDGAKVRVIILNTSDVYDTDGTPLIDGYNTAVQQEQFAWFCDTALDFSDKDDPNEWAVITMAHDKLSTVGGTGNPFATVITALTTGSSATATGSRTVNGYTFNLNKSVDYSSQGAVEYIGHICGHMHDDTISEFATNYKEVNIACAVLPAYHYVDGTRTQYTRTKGTAEELLFDTVCINRKTKTVDLKRFGVGSDRQFTY